MVKLPDLSAISSVLGLADATSDRVVAGLSTGGFLGSSATSSASAIVNGTFGRSFGPATIVDLSDHAKAVLAQAASDKVVADRLASQIQASKGRSGGGESNATDTTPRSIFDQIHDIGRELVPSTPTAGAETADRASDRVLAGTPIWRQEANADNIGILRAGAKLYNKAQAMQDLAANGGQFATGTDGYVVSDDVLFVMTAHMEVARTITDLRNKGLTDAAQALGSALENGTLEFQKAAEVPDLNMTSWMVHFADAGGGGEMGSTSLKPTGSVKAALDRGEAIALGMGDRGNFYVTW